MKYFLNDSNCICFHSKTHQEIGVGNVLIVEYIGNNKDLLGKLTVVKKSKNNPDHKDKLVFPGGMTRLNCDEELGLLNNNINELQRKSLIDRVEAEVGFKETDLQGLKLILKDNVFYSEYNIRNTTKKVCSRISVWHCKTTNENLITNDPSVSNPRWISINDSFEGLYWAPANMYIFGEYVKLNNQFDMVQEKVKKMIDEKKQECINFKNRWGGF